MLTCVDIHCVCMYWIHRPIHLEFQCATQILCTCGYANACIHTCACVYACMYVHASIHRVTWSQWLKSTVSFYCRSDVSCRVIYTSGRTLKSMAVILRTRSPPTWKRSTMQHCSCIPNVFLVLPELDGSSLGESE